MSWPLLAQSEHPDPLPASFAVASIKLNKSGRQIVDFNIEPSGRFVATGITLQLLFQIAYNVKEFQISGEPSWFDTERYDVEARPDPSFGTTATSLPPGEASQQIIKMLQSLLAERCKLVFRRNEKEHSAFALVVAKNGPKLTPSTLKATPKLDPSSSAKDDNPPPGEICLRGRGYLTGTAAGMSALADSLSRFVESTVVDQTGLAGRYDFTLKWTPGDSEHGLAPRTYSEGDARPTPDPTGPSLFTALQDQLGLKLEKQKTIVGTVAIEHVERPSQN